MAVPPVVAVVVTHDPGSWFDETLASLAAQTYPDLSVLVVDAASEVDPTPRIAAALPKAFVRRLEENRGFAASANLNPARTGPSMFEPVHGTAPDIAGQNKANPIAAIISLQLMLDFLGEADATAKVAAAVKDPERYTGSTTEIGDAVADAVKNG